MFPAVGRRSHVPVLVPGSEKALILNGVHLCLWPLLKSCPDDRLPSHQGGFVCLGLSICICFTCQLTRLSLGWGEVVWGSTSCGSNTKKQWKDRTFSKPLGLSCAWDFSFLCLIQFVCQEMAPVCVSFFSHNRGSPDHLPSW